MLKSPLYDIVEMETCTVNEMNFRQCQMEGGGSSSRGAQYPGLFPLKMTIRISSGMD